MPRTVSRINVFAAVALVALSAGCHRSAASVAQASATPELQGQLLAIENDIYRANNECDYKYFASIEAEEFIFIGGDGSVTTRAQDLASEKDCKRGNFVYTIDEPKVQRYGNVAIINARITTASAAGNVLRRARFTDVFVWRDGRWQLVSGQSTRIAP